MTKKRQPLNKFVRFTGIAFQMGLTIYLGNLLGEYLDQKYPNENDAYTKGVTLLAVFVSMFSVIMQVSKISKTND
ncbi:MULTISPECIES: AtpZ/AtpI family protein [Tenacibaculum]|uniref:F0F1-ATPase subunit n=1 Tax=Tenacibaculum todarodis TaxID=1850252 RepID=A0A1L3JLE0_9FLAO|nr:MULTISPECIES: AtpZ/AtpI family protein [Tenacibaculum]APG65965.1 hypothetical protein LPB136_11590 [Tenacibaculum todarodis]MCH3881462.1 AtpZ/AtpI family protein [Tenacibaculum aquimarinum]MCH3883641.1 AtpZ/AtpI family protein [Tenacibaculum aquimarinum]MDO6598944.1 AtpZ/AtpI family protein [Tenacibaculum sp. 1_MG-2023]